MLKKLATQNHKYLFFTTAEKAIRENIQSIISEWKTDMKNSIFVFKNNPIVIDQLMQNIADNLVFLYKERNESPYIEVKYLGFSIGTFKIGEPTELYNGATVIKGFTNKPEILYEVAKQVVEKMLDNILPIVNLPRTSSEIDINKFYKR